MLINFSVCEDTNLGGNSTPPHLHKRSNLLRFDKAVISILANKILSIISFSFNEYNMYCSKLFIITITYFES